jgi:hypothetical protein
MCPLFVYMYSLIMPFKTVPEYTRA